MNWNDFYEADRARKRIYDQCAFVHCGRRWCEHYDTYHAAVQKQQGIYDELTEPVVVGDFTVIKVKFTPLDMFRYRA